MSFPLTTSTQTTIVTGNNTLKYEMRLMMKFHEEQILEMRPYFSYKIFISELDFKIDKHEYTSKDNSSSIVRQSNKMTS